MKRLLLILLLIPIVFGTVLFAADTSYVLLRVRGTEQVPANMDKGNYFQQQLIAALQHEWRKKPITIVSSEDSEQVAKRQFALVIEINFLEVHINDPIINQQNKSLSRDVHANTYKDEAEDLRKQDANVSAEMIITEKSVTALMRVSASTVKLPDAVVNWSEIIAETYFWENKSATYTGSYQALGIKDVELVRSKPRPVPRQEEVYKGVVKQCINTISGKIPSPLQ